MEITHRFFRKFIGQHVHCHTHFGTFQGVIVDCTKHHVILGIMPRNSTMPWQDPEDWHRPFLGGPGGPMGPGPGPMGPGPGMGGGGGGGGGWNLAIPLAAIIGVTAIGMHWW